MPRARKVKPAPGPVTERILVGNLGCIRFPLTIRQASGIKRGDRLAVSVEEAGTIVLAKLPQGLDAEALAVESCACQDPGGGCREVAGPLTVGWSYVQFDSDRATSLGLLPSRPLKLVAEPYRISVVVERGLKRAEINAITPVRCPP